MGFFKKKKKDDEQQQQQQQEENNRGSGSDYSVSDGGGGDEEYYVDDGYNNNDHTTTDGDFSYSQREGGGRDGDTYTQDDDIYTNGDENFEEEGDEDEEGYYDEDGNYVPQSQRSNGEFESDEEEESQYSQDNEGDDDDDGTYNEQESGRDFDATRHASNRQEGGKYRNEYNQDEQYDDGQPPAYSHDRQQDGEYYDDTPQQEDFRQYDENGNEYYPDENDGYYDEDGNWQPNQAGAMIVYDENQQQPYNEPEQYEDEYQFEARAYYEEEDYEDEKKKNNWCGFILCCLCCCCLIIAIILLLFFLLRDKNDDANDRGIDSEGPESAALVNTVIFPAIADTYLRGGAFADISFGQYETWEVQNAPSPDGRAAGVAYSLLQFDLVGLPPNTQGRERELVLQLTHVESANPKEHNISIVRLPDDPNLDIESLTWNTYSPPTVNTEDGPSFVVTQSDSTVEIDITQWLPTAATSGTRQLRNGAEGQGKNRNLQSGGGNKLFIMLESRSDDPVASSFRSREYSETALRPRIIHNFVTIAPTASPTISPQPSVSSAPSASSAPTQAPIPDGSTRPPVSFTPAPTISLAPTISAAPSDGPTISVMPSASPSAAPSPSPTISAAPSDRPTISLAPSISHAPTGTPTIPPTGYPTVSPAPSVSPTRTPQPSVSAEPSVSMQPSTCAEYLLPFLVPPLYDMAGSTENALPPGAVTYADQRGNGMTFRITQLWSEQDVVWIAPYYYKGSKWNCPKVRGVTPGQTLEYSVPCFQGRAIFLVIVNDWSFSHGLDLIPMDGCPVDPDDIDGRKVLYAFNAVCSDPPDIDCPGLANYTSSQS